MDAVADGGRLDGHAVFDPPRWHADEGGEVGDDSEVGLEPDVGVEEVIEMTDADVAGDPGTIDDQGYRYFIGAAAFGHRFEKAPLFGFHLLQILYLKTFWATDGHGFTRIR